jgi:hypothetical protein
MAWRHAPFDKKNRGAMYCRCALFRLVSFELSNFDAIVKIEKKADCRQKEKKKGGDEEGRSSLMPKPNDILQQVYKMFHPPYNCVNL